MRSTSLASRRALTLVELLAVVVLLAIVASVGIVGLASTDGLASLERLGFEWRALDARARILALQPTSGSVILSVRPDSLNLTVSGAPDLNTSVPSPRGVSVQIQIDSETNVGSDIRFDARGCSPDYLLQASMGEHARRWSIAGETGWITAVHEAGAGGVSR